MPADHGAPAQVARHTAPLARGKTLEGAWGHISRRVNNFLANTPRLERTVFAACATILVSVVTFLYDHTLMTYPPLLLLTGAAAAFFCVMVWKRTGDPQLDSAGQSISGERYARIGIYADRDIDLVNALVRTVFPNETPNDEEVRRILQKNRKATIGLVETGDGRHTIVGAASCWPVGRQVYEGIKYGTLNEDEITADHVLTEEEARNAEEVYLYIPVVVVKDARTIAGQFRGFALAVEFLSHVRETYQGRNGTTLMFLTGFTPQGRHWAESRMGMRLDTMTRMYGKDCPFFEEQLTEERFNRWLERENELLRFCIGLGRNRFRGLGWEPGEGAAQV